MSAELEWWNWHPIIAPLPKGFMDDDTSHAEAHQWMDRASDEIASLRAALSAAPQPAPAVGVEQMREALVAALGLAELANTMTSCRADDDYVWGIRDKIRAALTTEGA